MLCSQVVRCPVTSLKSNQLLRCIQQFYCRWLIRKRGYQQKPNCLSSFRNSISFLTRISSFSCLRGSVLSLEVNRWFSTFAMDNKTRKQLLQPYEPPHWAADLTVVPTYRVQLANVNTPIQRWYLPGIPDGYEVYIKRDDMLGCELSGNKVRKLEFLLADAIQQGCTSVITCGGIQSNHCRTTALAARQLGLQPYLLLRSPSDPGHGVCVGNALLNHLVGSHMYLIPQKAQQVKEIIPRMQQLAGALKKEKGEDAYIVPIGGSTALGLYGYLEGFNELLQQKATDRFSDIVLATGSGGSTAGLAIGNYLTQSKMKCHGMLVCDGLKYFTDHINDTLKDIGLMDKCGVQSDDIVDLVDGVKGQGYGISTQEELDFIAAVSMATGILLDPTYTGKAALHLVKQLHQNPQRFQGNKILFIHTGGIFGLFDGRMDEVIKESTTSSIHPWFELTDDVPWLP